MFYVYEHWRTDLDECFYVGKGHGKRAFNMYHRNRHHKAVQEKIKREGFSVEVKIIACDLTEDDAYQYEIERISYWKEAGIILTNLAVGGRGGSAGVAPWIKGRKHTEATLKKMSAALVGKKRSAEHTAKLAAYLSAPSHRKKLRLAIQAANATRVWSLESRTKISQSLAGRPRSPQAIEKTKLALKGKPKTEAHRLAIIEGKKRAKMKKLELSTSSNGPV